MERAYMIDSNALSKLSRQQRVSDFFQENCHVPSEVLHEARFFPDIDALKDNEYPMTGRVLEILIEVMATVSVDDTKLVDLYANRGNADPIVVACAVDGQRASQHMLFGPNWVVVSNDKAVRAKAEEFGIEVWTSAEFAAILDGQGHDSAGD